jgi:L-cysteate sulfo-lyase
MTGAPFKPGDIAERVARFPRVALVHRPTPLRKLDRLSAELGGPGVWIKRDDLTGLAFGGNKSRKLEFIIPDVLAKKADLLVTWAGLQSNWAMQTAAACRRFGVRPVLVLFKPPDLAPEDDGNLLLDRILGADVRIREAERGKIVRAADALAAAEEVAREMRAQGHVVYVVPVGGSMPQGSLELPLGAVSYVEAFAEMLEQARVEGFVPAAAVHATGSGATQAGLVVGARALAPKTRIVGIGVSDEKTAFARDVVTIARATEAALEVPAAVGDSDIVVFDEYIRDGYGIVNREVAEVIRRVFITEGIVLDPIYTSKAMTGFLDLVRRGYFKKSDQVVFFHTGGTPALFPNRRKIMEYLGGP